MSNAQGTPVLGQASSPQSAILARLLAGGGMSPVHPMPSSITPMPGPPAMMGGGPPGQYTASPAAQEQIQQLLAGQARAPFTPTSPGVNPAMMTPGMIMARGLVPTTKEGGAQGLPPGGFFGGLMGGSNRSPIGDIAGALALGLPISDESWRAAGYGPGGGLLGG